MFGIGTTAGITIGILVAGQLAAHLGIAYLGFGVVVIVAALLFVLLNRDFSSKDAPTEKLTFRAFVAGFWISPRKHPDFAWAFAARFLFILGYFVVFAPSPDTATSIEDEALEAVSPERLREFLQHLSGRPHAPGSHSRRACRRRQPSASSVGRSIQTSRWAWHHSEVVP